MEINLPPREQAVVANLAGLLEITEDEVVRRAVNLLGLSVAGTRHDFLDALAQQDEQPGRS